MKIFLNSLVIFFLIFISLILSDCKKEENGLPVLITVPAKSIKATSALLGGQVAYDGGAEITEKGACFGTAPDPDISGSKVTGGKGTGSYRCALTGLNPGTLYYARAFATNNEGTAYGGEIKFTTGYAEAPIVITTVDPIGVYYYDAVMGTNVMYDGGAPVTEKGICWGTSENPTLIGDNRSINYRPVDTIARNYWCIMYPLKPNSVYYARAYAINMADTSYGDVKSITTLAEPEVTTLPASEIDISSAVISGNVTSILKAFSVNIGICYGTESNPTVNGIHKRADISQPGDFTCTISGLASGTTYYVRAYVQWEHYVNESFLEYTLYGNEVTFTTK